MVAVDSGRYALVWVVGMSVIPPSPMRRRIYFPWEIVAIALTIAAILGGLYLLDAATCDRVSNDAGLESEYRLIGGCYVEHEGRMVPYDRWWVQP